MSPIKHLIALKRYRCITISLWRNLILLCIFFTPFTARCQSDDEIIVSVNIQRIGSIEIPAIIHKDIVYLPIKKIFDFIQIKNTLSPDIDTEEGYFINPKATFLIDKSRNRITYQNKTFNVSEKDMIRTATDLYLRSDYFGNVFGLHCAYSFSDLTITISTTIDLPAIIEYRQQQMRQNIGRLKGETKADTIIKRKVELFHVGTADWFVNTLQENGKWNSSINLAMGALVAGGEANLYLNYNSNVPLKTKEQYYRWRYVNNEKRFLKQTTIGKIFTQSTSSLFSSVTGVQLTNTPTINRKSFGTYRISDKTEPASIVEIYVNNILVNYTKADASGFYTFEIPLVYGNSVIRLRFYGAYGEERTQEKYITIPFNFIPLNEVEYTVTAGIVNDNSKSRFVRSVVNYGLTRHITIGGGTEYLSSVTAGKMMPFLTASMQVLSNLFLSGEYTHGVRTKGIISYRMPGNLQLDLNYNKYDKGQNAIRNNYLEEKKVVLSVPLHTKNFRGLSRLTVNQYVLAKYKFANAELLLAGVIGGIHSNITTYAQFYPALRPDIYSNLSVNLRLSHGIKIIPQVKYHYRQQKIGMVRIEAEKNIFKKGFINVAYEKNIDANNHYISMALQYNFDFAQTSFAAKRSNKITTTTQTARGSLMYDEKTSYFEVDNQNNVGKGGLTILPFLDINCNGLRDMGEPKVAGLSFHINGGQIQRIRKDTIIHVLGLDGNHNYLLEMDNTFDNIAWQIKNKKIKVYIDPNHHTLIQVPVAVVGEVTGTVYHAGDKGNKGIGYISVNIYSNGKFVAKTISEQDGYFTFLGLVPGKYTARIDAGQLRNIQMSSTKELSFTINAKKDGDLAEGLKFILHSSTGSIPGSLVDNGLLKDTDGDGVPDHLDKELITPASCFPADAEGIGNCNNL